MINFILEQARKLKYKPDKMTMGQDRYFSYEQYGTFILSLWRMNKYETEDNVLCRDHLLFYINLFFRQYNLV